MTSVVTSCALALIAFHLPLHTWLASAAEPHAASAFYTMYLPESCSTSSLTGFNKGVIISQRGDRYAPDTSCTLYLRVRSSSRAIRITFDHMDLPETRPGLCEDYIEFYAPSTVAKDAMDSVAGPFCGHTPPSDFFSNGTSVVVRFTSNSIRELSGFRFRFERISYSVDLCATDGASLRECDDVIVQHAEQQHTVSGEWPLSRYCCYAIILIFGIYASWQHRMAARTAPVTSFPRRSHVTYSRGGLLPR